MNKYLILYPDQTKEIVHWNPENKEIYLKLLPPGSVAIDLGNILN